MNQLRFQLALLVGKLTGFLLQKLTGRGTNTPGVIMLKLCPEALRYFTMPKKVICVTGTNGKTGTSNMITYLLRSHGMTVANNSEGSNMAPGLVTTLAKYSNLKGKVKADVAVLEVDERSSPYIYTKFTPDYLLCTNLFRDSIKRNGHSEYIFHKVDDVLPASTKLILNGNDAISGLLGQNRNEQMFFAVERTSESTEGLTNTACDLRSCPNCHRVLHYDFYHYHHLGEPHCECGFEMPKAKYLAKNVDFAAETFSFAEEGKEDISMPFAGGNLFQVFNVTAAAAVCREMGMDGAEIAKGVSEFTASKTRFADSNTREHRVISMLCKNQNPVSSSQSIAYLNRVPGTKDVVLLITDSKDAHHGSEDISWLYDTDFDALKREDVHKVILGGTRCEDLALRLCLAGIPQEKLCLYPDYQQLCKDIGNVTDHGNTVVIYYELYAIDVAGMVRKTLEAGVQA